MTAYDYTLVVFAPVGVWEGANYLAVCTGEGHAADLNTFTPSTVRYVGDIAVVDTVVTKKVYDFIVQGKSAHLDIALLATGNESLVDQPVAQAAADAAVYLDGTETVLPTWDKTVMLIATGYPRSFLEEQYQLQPLEETE